MMNSHQPGRWSLLLAAGLLAGCVSSPQISRIEDNRAIYEQWPVEIRQAVLDGKVELAMTTEMVALALGRPTSISNRRGTAGGGNEVVWTYFPLVLQSDSQGRYQGGSSNLNDGTDPMAGRSGVATERPSVGGVGPPVGTALGLTRTPVVAREIIFRDGLVVHVNPPAEK